MIRLKRWLVDWLERTCTWKDTRLPDRLAGFRGCWLAKLSGRLDERWGTGMWQPTGEDQRHPQRPTP